jgi:hypothetical protein
MNTIQVLSLATKVLEKEHPTRIKSRKIKAQEMVKGLEIQTIDLSKS